MDKNFTVTNELYTEVKGILNNKKLSLINKGNSIEINYFFFDCKEWAYNKGYSIYSHNNACHIHYDVASFKSFCEQQSVFDACQWIIERERRKNKC